VETAAIDITCGFRFLIRRNSFLKGTAKRIHFMDKTPVWRFFVKIKVQISGAN
jgi:hypothetical protein